MKRKFEVFAFGMVWFAVIAQFFLMFYNRQTDVPEMIIRFFSFFTILTNILVGLYFMSTVLGLKVFPFKWLSSKGSLTAITAFILIVGIVYQIALREVWKPTGLQLIVDELLHTIIPMYVLVFWCFNASRDELRLKPILYWLIYPVVFIIFILVRGHFSTYYPYPFLNVPEIGYGTTFLNVGIIFGLVLLILSSLLLIGRTIVRNKIKI